MADPNPPAASDRAVPAPGPGGPPPRGRSRLRRWLVRAARACVLAYVGVAAIFAAFQSRLIFPGASTQGQPEAVVVAGPGEELVELRTARGERVVALFGRALGPEGAPRLDAATCPTILYFYGNAMCLADAAGVAGDFRRLGANVLVPDYLGYGMSAGRPGESGCRATAEAALAHLHSRPDVDRGRIVVAGWSLGGAVALDLASREPVAGVATFSTFTRMADMARLVVPFLPSSLLLVHRFDSIAKVGRVGCPILIGHGRRDGIIPFAMADRLAEAARGPVTRATIPDADHNDFFRAGGGPLLAALGRFIVGLPRRP